MPLESVYLAALLLPLLGLLAAACFLLPPWASAAQRELADSARQRAEQLLAELLTEAELRQLKTHGYLDVRSPSCPDRVYRVYHGGGPVQVREAGRASVLLCVQPQVYLPEADVVLMHKLLIEGAERTYLRTANVVGWRDRDWLERLRT